ncbi:bifunctional DNA primase/polymerase [Chloroflexota bacterium]
MLAIDAFTLAFKLNTLGFSVVPSGGGDKGKVPLVDWKQYQERQPTDAELHKWEECLRPQLWGIVTGSISDVCVFDADSSEARRMFEIAGLMPHVITPRLGAHFYFKHPRHHVKTVVGLLLGLDVRADGGFCNVVGANVLGQYEILTLPAPDTLYPWSRLPERIRLALNGAKPAPQESRAEGIIPEGQRNAHLTSLAGSMRQRGMAGAAIEAALIEVNRLQCQPPLEDTEVRRITRSVSRYDPDPLHGNNTRMYDRTLQSSPTHKRCTSVTDSVTATHETENKTLQAQEQLSQRVLAWVKSTTGWWVTEELDRDLGISGTRGKNYRRLILFRLKEQGVLEQHPRINKQWRYVNTRVTSLDFKAAGRDGVLPIKWPLGIERYVNLFPGNLAVAAGAPNAGKTALFLDFIRLNMNEFPIFYFCSEMGSVELRNRLELFEGITIEDWNFEAVERASDFADVIRPDCVNVIDYLEMTTELYQVNAHLTAISHKVGSGLAIVALQKKAGAQMGRGQEFGMEKPKLYLSMDRGKLQIVKGKSWAQKNVNPAGLQVGFKIVNGCRFEITKEWDWDR